MIKSIYFALLNQGTDGNDDFNDWDDEIEQEGNLIYMPLQRITLKRGKKEIDVADVEFAKVNASSLNLDGYPDAKFLKDYPVAVSFTVKKRQYGEYRNTIASNEGIIRLDCHDGRFNYSFVGGKEIAAISEGNQVKLVYGFAKEESL